MKKLAAILALILTATLVLNMAAYAAPGQQPLSEKDKNREQIVRADDKKPAQQKPEDKKQHQIKPDGKKAPQQKPGDQKPPQQKYRPCEIKNCHGNDAHKHHNIWYFGSANNAGKPGHGNPPKK